MHKILIIEDDRVVSTVYRRKLEEAGFAVEVCHNGQDGFYRVHEAPFTIVLLDLMLPEMNGMDFLKKIRAQPRFEHLPVLVLTNFFSEDEIAAAHVAGATRIFNKAITSPAIIVEAISNLLKAHSALTGVSELDATTHTLSNTAAEKGTGSESERMLEDPLKVAEAGIKHAASLLPSLSRAGEASSRVTLLLEMLRGVHHFANVAAVAGLSNVARVAFALETLLQQLQARPDYVNPSTLRTVATTLDFIIQRYARGQQLEKESSLSVSILVVDDDPVSRRAISKGLEKASLKCVAVNSPDLALSLLEENRFDLAILDVEMPGIDGFELCRRIRVSRENGTIPVLFVTNLTDLESRSTSILSGGSDYIAKPFLAIELGLKALLHITKAATGTQ